MCWSGCTPTPSVAQDIHKDDGDTDGPGIGGTSPVGTDCEGRSDVLSLCGQIDGMDATVRPVSMLRQDRMDIQLCAVLMNI